jgi:hypothetical protein
MKKKFLITIFLLLLPLTINAQTCPDDLHGTLWAADNESPAFGFFGDDIYTVEVDGSISGCTDEFWQYKERGNQFIAKTTPILYTIIGEYQRLKGHYYNDYPDCRMYVKLLIIQFYVFPLRMHGNLILLNDSWTP